MNTYDIPCFSESKIKIQIISSRTKHYDDRIPDLTRYLKIYHIDEIFMSMYYNVINISD